MSEFFGTLITLLAGGFVYAWGWSRGQRFEAKHEAERVDLARIQIADIKDGDVIILRTDGYISDEAAARMRDYLSTIFPKNKSVVLGDGLNVGIMHKTEGER